MARDNAYLQAEKQIEAAHRSRLIKLDLSNHGTPISVLPESLTELIELRSLDLNGNLLTTLPESLEKLTQLQELNLSHNRLTTIPTSIRKLKHLQRLDLESNQLTSIPEWLGELTQLKILNLGGNRLKSLPETLGKFGQLSSLILGGNQLTDLPASLGTLIHLQQIDLNSVHYTQGKFCPKNPLNPELAEAVIQGLEAIKAYLRAKAESQIILNEAKLILIGEGEVGKTCLMDSLLDNSWREHDTTHGIEIKSFQVTSPDTQTEITLNGWDFGGQRVYRPTHQLFFSAPAVYLVVWKPREGPQQGFVKEWIKLVKHREPDAKILVVATHGGPQQRQPDIDRQELWDLFGRETIADFFFVDSKPDAHGNRKGIDELKLSIARLAAQLPEVGRSVPKSFQDVREALSARNVPYLPLDEVLAICRAHNMDDEIARLFITISHRLGHLTHYQHDPALRDIVILRPDWLAGAMSYVLDDKETRDTNGLVKFSRLSKLWNDPSRPKDTRYPESLHRIFLSLMGKFDLSYRVIGLSPNEDSDPVSLIAQLVSNETPTDEVLNKAWRQVPESGMIQQTQICRIVDSRNGKPANAEGLFYQLIVRLHRYSLGRVKHTDSVHWQRGLILDAEYNGRAFLRHVGDDVHITVRAAYPQGFLTALTEEVRFLVESFWEGLRCEITVPCLNPIPCKGLLEVRNLIESKQKKRNEYPCPVCNEWQSIETLLQNAPVATKPISDDRLYAELVKANDEIRNIRPALEKQLEKNQKEVLNRFTDVSTDLQKLFSQAENNLNIMLQALADEAKEGPRLFSLVPVNRDGFDPRNWVTSRFRLTLWCEHSRLPLPALNQDKKIGVYEFDLTRQWVKEYSPLIKAFTITLKSLLPVAFSAAKLVIDATTYKDIESELDFSKACIDALISEGEGISQLFVEDTIGDDPIGLPREKSINAQNATLREFHSLLNKVDPNRKYGDLVKVTNKQQKFLWVHNQFSGEY